jgi:hypothetical protein
MTDNRVDELREHLRALGYLDAGVDRFLLAPAGRGGGPVSLAVRASIRVGVLGGVLLGPAAAIGVGARLPGLITGVRDGVVIALYLAIFFFLAISVMSFVVTVTATALTRVRTAEFATYATRIARAAGWVTSLACLLYLTLWWRNANAGFGWSAPVWTAFALVVAVVISLLLGHAQRVTTLAALASAAGPAAALPAAEARSWRVILGGGALAFAGAAILLVLTTSSDDSAPAVSPALTVVSQGATVRVLAVDGVDPTLVDERDWLARWGYTGSRRPLVIGDTTDPARTWTTIATGEPPEVHGIHAIEGRRVAGIRGMLTAEGSASGRALQQATDLVRLSRPSLSSRNERHVMTFWEVAEAAGLRTKVVNWWATWPAVTLNGTVLSDRAVLRLEHGGQLDAEIAPPATYAELQKRWPQIAADAQARARGAFHGVVDREVASILERSAALDAIVLKLDEVLGQGRDLDVLYLPGLDIAQHALLRGQAASSATPSALSARLAALREYHRFLGELVQPWLKPVDKRVVVIITAPGRIGPDSAGRVTVGTWLQLPPPLDPRTRPRDMEVVDAPPPFTEVTDAAQSLDIAPTVLNILGVPISRELPGRPLHVSPLGSSEPRFVAEYGRPISTLPARAGAPLDQEMIDRLRSLGYIK